MGFDKPLVAVGGTPIAQRLVEIVRPLAGEVLISANESQTFRFLNAPIVRDIYPGQGPLAGLHAAMLHSEKSDFLVLACDMPNLHERLLRAIVESAGDRDAVVPRTSDGRMHALCGVYRRSCLELLGQQLAAGRNRVSDLVSSPDLRVHFFESGERGFPDSDFVNLNDENDLSSFRAAFDSDHPIPGC
jgi:molybdopterin-guanine dinucleotide biosynthesis protein A